MKLFSKVQEPSVIDFSTTTKSHRNKAHGVGVFEGRLPAKIDGITFNGESIVFTEPSTPVKLQDAGAKAEYLKKKKVTVDCFGFLALYTCAFDVENVPTGSERWLQFDLGESQIETTDINNGDVLALGASYHDFDRPIIQHGVVATETNQGMMFMHVLGSNGPVAISGLRQAQDVFKGYVVRSIDSIRPSY